jgi:putative spermidine/putrescine transport system ATP-binding protein
MVRVSFAMTWRALQKGAVASGGLANLSAIFDIRPAGGARNGLDRADEHAGPIVRFVDVQKTYDGERLVVRNLNLDVGRGEFLTLLGPSGSGKTTTLMMLAGFEAPTHGQIFLDGKSIHRMPTFKRNIGMVFQNYALFPHMTVWKNLAFPLEARRMAVPEVARRVERAIEMVQLGDLAGRRPAQLSGGQAQRVALARALVFEPLIVLMDEPLGALDRQLREAMQYEIKRIHQTLGITVIYVTHDQGEALTMSDRIAVFNGGIIEQLATPELLYESPQNAFVARFVGENNRLAGRVRATSGERCTVDVGGVAVHAVAVGALAEGQEVLLSLRPERVLLGPSSDSCENRFDATVREIVYVGDHSRIRLAVCGTETFIAKTGSAPGSFGMASGDRIRAGWHAADCRALGS